jgi:hypothetical protein
MPEPVASRHATALPSPSRRALVVAIAMPFAVHSVLVLMWVMPSNPIRDAIGPRLVERYVDNEVVPFEQNWSVFAPTPRRAGENVLVRAHFGETGRTTAWFDITADEDDRVRHLVAPSRIHTVTRRLGGDANEHLGELTDAELDVIRSDTPSRGELRRLPDDYLVVDDLLTRFASLYATARWGDGIDLVQVRIGHRFVPGFVKRHQVDFEDVPFTHQTLGWRQVVPGGAAAQDAFDGYVKRAPRAGGA